MIYLGFSSSVLEEALLLHHSGLSAEHAVSAHLHKLILLPQLSDFHKAALCLLRVWPSDLE